MSTMESFYQEIPATGETFSPLHVYFYLINSIMGSGFLAVPFAFQQAGLALGIIFLLFFTLSSYLVSVILVESMSRAEAIQRIRDDEISELIPSWRRVFSCKVPGAHTLLLSGEKNYDPQITARKFELAEMHNVWLGNKWRWVYIVLMLITYWGVMLSYAGIFAATMTQLIPLFGSTCDLYENPQLGTSCWYPYWVWLAIFSAWCISLVLAGLKEQKSFQYFMSFTRFAILLLIILMCIVRIGQGKGHSPVMANPAGIGSLSILVFANTCHPNIPTYVQYMYRKKESIHTVLKWLFTSTFFVYLCLGTTMWVAFDELPSFTTFAWKDYGSDNGGAWWAYMLQYVVLIFPALDVASAFPLNAICMSENLMSIKFPQLTIEELEALPKKTVYKFRLFTVLPPLLITVVSFDLGLALTFTGITAYYVVFINIFLLHMYTRHRFPKPSDYHGWWSPKSISLSGFWFFVCLALMNLGLVLFEIS